MSEDIHWKNYATRFRTFPSLLVDGVSGEVGMIICIPAIAEPELILTIRSILACQQPIDPVEVIILFNKNIMMSQDELKEHEDSFQSLRQWVLDQPDLPIKIHTLYVELFPDPKGGVGWARKYAMDEAARRLPQTGIIVCLDADCVVEENYLVEIEHAFRNNLKLDAASIYFEHSIDTLNDEFARPIIEYELHLRYLVHAQQWCGHPCAYYTVGSSMAIRRRGYLSQGGMNTRSAGEDFYLLQKFIETETFFEIRTTTVFPTSRISLRVPFGTGRAMQQLALKAEAHWLTTHFDIFKEIKPLFDSLEEVWKRCNEANSDMTYEKIAIICSLSDEVMSFLGKVNLRDILFELTRHTSGYPSFRKRFFRFFNAFQMIRYMHYMRDHAYPDVEVQIAVNSFFHHTGSIHSDTALESLQRLRRLDKEI